MATRPPTVSTEGVLEALRPAHRLALEAARSELYGVAWLLVEEAREMAVKEPQRGLAQLEALRRSLLGSALEDHLGPQMRDLEATVLSYLADGHRVVPDHLSAERCLREAGRALAVGAGRTEVVALLAETNAALARCQGRYAAALELLADAESRLLGRGFEARRAEVLGRRGAVLLRSDDDAQALETFETALELLPKGHAAGLRLFLLHNLAVTEVRLGHSRRALARLCLAAPLYALHGHALLRAQRLWVLGKAQTEVGQWAAADEALRGAVHGTLELGFGKSALLVLLDLAALYAETGQVDRLIELETLLCQLARHPAAGSFLRARLLRSLALARRKGRATCYLEALLCRLEP